MAEWRETEMEKAARWAAVDRVQNADRQGLVVREDEAPRVVGEHLIGRYQTCMRCGKRFASFDECVATPCEDAK